MAILNDRDALATPADGDLLFITDVSDTTDAATGTDKKITYANLTATLQAKPAEGAFADGDKTKLDNIETAADVTDETNVKASLDGATITTATVATDDKVLIQDTNDSNNLKTVTTQAVANLATPEGTAVKSTGEAGGTKFLREDGDGTCSWQAPSDASTTVKGIVELAINTEVNTGTSDALAVTPDALAGSNFGIRYVQVTLNGTTALTTSEKAYFRIPAGLTGMNLVSVAASVGTGAAGSSSSGTPTFTVRNVTDNSQMLSTSLTVDANEYTSATAAAAAVIDTGEDDVVTDDLIEVAVTTAGTGVTYAVVTLGFQLH
jgi:hypothetical protein